MAGLLIVLYRRVFPQLTAFAVVKVDDCNACMFAMATIVR